MKARTCGHSVVLGLSLGALSLPSLAADALFVAGRDRGVDMLSVGIRTSDMKSWNLEGGATLSLLGEGTVSQWRTGDSGSQGKSLVDVGLTPVLRYFPAAATAGRFYLEAGVGIHGLSRTTLNSGKAFSTAFQFGEFLGAGLEFGARERCSAGVRLLHVSNGGLKEPNDGVTFGQAIVAYRF